MQVIRTSNFLKIAFPEYDSGVGKDKDQLQDEVLFNDPMDSESDEYLEHLWKTKKHVKTPTRRVYQLGLSLPTVHQETQTYI